MRLGKKKKLSPHYVGSHLILRRVGTIAYELDLPFSLGSIHSIFYVSMLKKCVGDPYFVVPIESVGISDSLSYEDVLLEILDRKVCHLRTKDVASVKVLWENQKVEEATWETEEDMKSKYPFLFPRLDNLHKV